uniref:Transcriptional regulator n=1 Tax=Panagrellus redivivus TaxID=6233 RepID=A0A7E4ZT45_PANRE
MLTLNKHALWPVFSNQHELTEMPDAVPTLPPPDTDDPLSPPFTPVAVASCLSKIANSAPGPDRIRFAHIECGISRSELPT